MSSKRLGYKGDAIEKYYTKHASYLEFLIAEF